MRALLRALGFLSVLPVGRLAQFEARDIPALLAAFPLAGAILGFLLGLFWHGVFRCLGMQLAAAFTVAAWAMLTRGFHLDGLSDCADGIGGYTPERRLAIMKDSHIGVFGTVAIVCVLLLKFALLCALTFSAKENSGPLARYIDMRQWLATAVALGVIFSAARLSPLLVACESKYAREEGLGKDFVSGAKLWTVLCGAVVPIALGVAWNGVKGLLPFGVAVITAFATRIFFARKLGGQTGDTMGASVELSEIAAMLALSVNWPQ